MLPTTRSTKILRPIRITTFLLAPCFVMFLKSTEEIKKVDKSPSIGMLPMIGSSPNLKFVPGILKAESSSLLIGSIHCSAGTFLLSVLIQLFYDLIVIVFHNRTVNQSYDNFFVLTILYHNSN